MTDTGWSAFPQYVISNNGTYTQGGMTLRDYFAAKAMQGLLASNVEASMSEFARRSYQMADEMLKEREL